MNQWCIQKTLEAILVKSTMALEIKGIEEIEPGI
jgi:hypothetical protein